MNGASQRCFITARTSVTMAFCPTHPDKKVFAKGKCRSCYFIDYIARRRKALAKFDPVKRSAIQNASDQRTLLNIVYRILCAELKPKNAICEAKLPGCTHKATQCHHKKGRRGILLIMSTYFGWQCDNCHKWCTTHSHEAKEMGLSLPINSQTDYVFTPREIELIKKYKIRTPKSVYIT